MAKQKGFIKLKGSLGGLTFYENSGESLIRGIILLNPEQSSQPKLSPFVQYYGIEN